MHLRIEADPDELREKSGELIKALITAIAPNDPELASRLEKALPERENELKLPVLRGLHERTAGAYERQMALMLKDIGKVLDAAVKKSDGDAAFFDYTKPLAERDGRAYNRVKSALKHRGYTDSDFEENGALYGMSVNELLDMALQKEAV